MSKEVVHPDYSQLDRIAKKKQESIDMSKVDEKTVKVAASQLKATQAEINGTKVSGMVQSIVANNFKNSGSVAGMFAPLVVSEDLYIVDGHHRWMALVIADMLNKVKDSPIKIEVYKIGLPVLDIMAMCYPGGPFDVWLNDKHHLKVNAPQGFGVSNV